MKRHTKLNDRQLTVLQRVGQGDNPVTSLDSGLAVTVYALRGRGLVTTPRHQGVWTAQITDMGRYYLEHRSYPPPPVPVNEPSGPRAPGVVSAEEVIEKVQQPGGMVRVVDPDEATRRAWRQAIHAAKSRGLVPDGHYLQHKGRDRGDLVVRLVRGEHPSTRYRGRHPIPVPATLDDLDPVVAAIAEDDVVQSMPTRSRERVLRVLQAVACEAGKRGYQVQRPRSCVGAQLRLIDNDDIGSTITIGQLTETRPHTPTAEELKARKLYPWQRIPQEYEQVPTGELQIEVDCGFSGSLRRHDGRRWRIEDKIWDVFAAIERAAERRLEQRAAQEERAAEAQRHRVDLRRRWEDAMAGARTRAVEDQRVGALKKQLTAWQHAQAVRAYAAALDD